jgi:hypothetical protein
MIPKNELKKGSWYSGSGRGSHVALWDGKMFHWIGEEWVGQPAVQSGLHYDEGGCFAPMELVPDRYPSVMQYQEMELKRNKRT